MSKRIQYPAGAIRTAAQIIAAAQADPSLYVTDSYIWAPCWNCGGSGNYPSSMDPPGKCRKYCWQTRDAHTHGKLPVSRDKWIKRQQVEDRRAYRDELERPERERVAAERQATEAAEQAERDRAAAERQAAVLAEKAKRAHVGTVGARMTLDVTLDAVVAFQGAGYQGGTRYLVRFVDADQNKLVWWTDGPPGVFVRGDGETTQDVWVRVEDGAAVRIVATVKAHETYKDEAQTVVQRVKFPLLAQQHAERQAQQAAGAA